MKFQRGEKLLFLSILIFCHSAYAREIVNSHFKLSSALKVSGLAELPPYDDTVSTANNGPGAAAPARLRLEPSFESGAFTIDAAYDNQLTAATGSGYVAKLALPNAKTLPFRLWPISYTAQGGAFLDTQQLDRAFVSFKSSALQITLGRQPLGFGRGMIFSAVDLFAPFGPLQIDQEWRAGVDALNIDYKISDTASIQGILVGGDSWATSAVGGRARGYFGPIDAEAIVAKRKQDIVYAVSTSASIGDLEAHGEASLFATPSGTPNALKLVAGLSNNFQIGSGLTTRLEYHYNGFGAASGEALDALLKSTAFAERLLDGSSQTLSAHSLGLSASYTFNERWSASFSYIQSLSDGSGIMTPSFSWDIAESLSLYAALFVAYGARPTGGVIQSEYGAITPAAILQLRVYD